MKASHVFLAGLMIAPVVHGQTTNCIVPPAGLVSWWRAENSALDNWDSNDGNANANFAPGKVGQAFSFGLNVVRVPDSVSLRLTNALSIEAWVNPSSVLGVQSRTIVAKVDANAFGPLVTFAGGYNLGIANNGLLTFALGTTSPNRTNVSLAAIHTVPTNQWTHVAATYDGSTMRLYLNGQPESARSYTGGVFATTADLNIGGIPLGASITGVFGGLIDELSIYSRALTELEIQQVYSADVNGKCLVPPSIVTQPQSQAIPQGEDVKFTVSVLGTRPLRYQWRFNNQSLAGATNAFLILEKVQSNRIGNYSVFITNALGFTISSNAMLTLLPAPVCTATPPGLISWWPGDGSTADAMGTNNILSFAPAAYATGKVDRAFNLIAGLNRIVVLGSPSLNFGSNADFSIEMWIKTGTRNTTYANVPLLEKTGISDRAAQNGYSLSLNRGQLAFALGAFRTDFGIPPATDAALTFISPGPDLRDAFFHHVAVSVRRNATNGGNLYVDGHVVLTFDATSRNINLTNMGSLYIGTPAMTASNSPFNGLIDEPAIYGRALSAAEILAISQAGATGKCKVPPSIIVQPISQRVTIGSNVIFSVIAAGSPKLSYQWLTGLLPPPVGAIPGATTPSLTFKVPDKFGSFAVRVTNLFGSVTSSTAVLTINNVPEAFSQTTVLNEDTPALITLSGSDRNKDPLSFVVVAPPARGTLTGTAPNLTYLPNLNYSGPDNFTFKVNDGLVDSAVATVTLNILPVNDAPVAPAQSVSLDEDTPAAITLAAFDVDGDALTYVLGAPSHGTLSGVAPNLVYQPATNYFGPDSFTYTASDGKTNSNLATVSLVVRPVNDAPFANIVVSPLVTNLPGVTNWVVLAAVCGDATVVLDGSGSSDVENDPLTYSWWDGTNQISSGVLATNLLSPGSHELSLQVSDGKAVGMATATVEVIAPAEGVGIIIVLLHESDLGRRNIQPLITSLKNAAAAFDRCDAKPGANQLEAFKNKVRAQVAPLNPELAARLTAAVEQVLDAVR